MTTKEYRAITQALKKVPQSREWQSTLDPETSERIKARVMGYVMAHGGQPAKALSFAQKFRMNFNIATRLVPQGFAYGFALFALLFGSGAFAAYARTALPGQTLYGAKIALEQTHARFVSNPADRARVQMEFAGRRLEEAKSVESTEQAVAAIQRFSKDVKQAKATLKQAADPAQIKAAEKEIKEKVQEYEVKLQETRVKPGREVGVAAATALKELEEAENALKEVKEEQKDEQVVKDEPLKDGEVGL